MSKYEVYKKYDSAFSYIKAEKKLMYWSWFIINAVLPTILVLTYSAYAKVEINEFDMAIYIAPIILFIFVMFKMFLSAIYPNYLFKNPESQGAGPSHENNSKSSSTTTHVGDASSGGDSGGCGGDGGASC